MRKIVLSASFLLQAVLLSAQNISLSQAAPEVYCSSGIDSFRATWNNIPAGSHIVFYQSTSPAFNPYAGQGDSIGFIAIDPANTSSNTFFSICPKILGIFIDACNAPPHVEQANEYMVITSGATGFKVSSLQVDLFPPANKDMNVGSGCPFGTPSAALMALLRTGTCDNTTLIAAGQADSIPPNALVIIFTGAETDYGYDFTSYCSSGQPIYILQNSCTQPNGSFANNPPGGCPGNGYRPTSIRVGSCFDRLTYDACTLPPFDAANPNANDGNYVIHLSNTDTSTIANGGILNNSADKCNGVVLDSIVKTQTIKYPIPADGSGNPSTDFCNTGYHYIKAITNPAATQPVSNSIRFRLVCTDLTAVPANQTICSGDAAVIHNSSGDPSATFSWTVAPGPNIQGASIGSGNTISQTLTNTGATLDSITYVITAKDTSCTATQIVRIYVNSKPASFFLGNDTAVCGVFSIPLNSGNPTTVWKYNGSQIATGAFINATQFGTYIGLLNSSCGAVSDTIIISPKNGQVINLGNDTAYCGAFSRTLSTGNPATQWNTGAISASITVSTPGTYIATINGACGAVSDTILISQSSGLSFTFGTDNTTICKSDSITLDAGVGFMAYLWNTSETSSQITVHQPGIYWVKVTKNGCSGGDTINVTEINKFPPFSLGRDTSFCGTFSLLLVSNIPQTVWLRDNMQFASGASVAVSQAGTYIGKASNSCGAIADTIVISQSAGFTFSFGSDTASVCKSDSLLLDAGPGYTSYAWNTGETIRKITVKQAGEYWVQVTKNGCAASDTITVLEIDKLPSFYLGDNVTFCDTFSFRLESNLSQTTWYRNNVAFAAGSSVVVKQAGTYRGAASNSCGSVADTIVITSGSIPQVDLGRDTGICAGASIALDATVPGSNMQYLWKYGETTPSITVSQFDKYWVEVTNGICTAYDTIFIDTLSKPQPFSLGNDTAYCGSFTRLLFTGDAITQWSTGDAGPQITVTAPGTYIAVNANPCGSESDTITIVQYALPAVFIGRDTTVCDSMALAVSGNYNSILWSTGDTVTSILITSGGVYSIAVSDSICTAYDSITIKKDCPYDVYIPSAFSPNNDNQNDVLVPLSPIKSIIVTDFFVFDRWGEKVFESHTFTPGDISKGWDGTYKGKEAQVDIYMYYYNAKLPDNTIKSYKGTVTLVR
jgi:gliding motility-associated-like protein